MGLLSQSRREAEGPTVLRPQEQVRTHLSPPAGLEQENPRESLQTILEGCPPAVGGLRVTLDSRLLLAGNGSPSQGPLLRGRTYASCAAGIPETTCASRSKLRGPGQACQAIHARPWTTRPHSPIRRYIRPAGP